MANYHLRPPSTTPSKQPVFLPSPAPNMSRSRRPLSPSSLRDVNLTPDTDNPSRKYPAPPTGHDLMAMFPPAPPAFIGTGSNTSGYFQRQERAFFAQAGKEIVRVRVEVDVPQEAEPEHGRVKGRNRDTWPPPGHTQSPHPLHRSPPPHSSTAPPPPPPFPLQSTSRQSRAVTIPITSTPLNSSTNQPPPNLHPPTPYHAGAADMHTPPHDSSHSGPSNSDSQSDEFRDNPDESWRRPMPYAERRRAGKHTRRVVVRN